LAGEKELYFVFYTLKYALRGNQTEIVSHQPVPQWAQAYPLMRWSGLHDQSGKPVGWKIFKASDALTVQLHQSTPTICTLTPEQERLSIHLIRPHLAMVRELARGWTPERAEELRLKDVAEAVERKEKQVSRAVSGKKEMRYFLYFPKKADAESAGERLRDRGYSAEVRKGANGENWLALATKNPPTTGEQMDEVRDEMEALAAQFGGEYDGWEAAIDSLGFGNAPHGHEVN
jgi:hypothetical protein